MGFSTPETDPNRQLHTSPSLRCRGGKEKKRNQNCGSSFRTALTSSLKSYTPPAATSEKQQRSSFVVSSLCCSSAAQSRDALLGEESPSLGVRARATAVRSPTVACGACPLPCLLLPYIRHISPPPSWKKKVNRILRRTTPVTHRARPPSLSLDGRTPRLASWCHLRSGLAVALLARYIRVPKVGNRARVR
jgi:hypothetical protein